MDRSEGSGRPALDRARIVSTAVTFIDASGVPALTMRRLGALMGVEAMSLYRYVASREALLDAVVDEVMAELDADPEVSAAGAGWAEVVVSLAHGIRRMALAHPRAFPLVAGRPTVAPFVRPPLRTLAWVETFLGALTDDGFAPAEAVRAYHDFTSLLLGHLLLEVGLADRSDPEPAVSLDGRLSAYPAVARLGKELDHVDADREFEAVLTLLVERLDRLHDA